MADSTTDGLKIDVEVDRDKVQLNGFVDSKVQVDRAGEIARSISGVASVENNLQVSGGTRSPGEYIDDKALSTSVKAALVDDRLAPGSEIDVEVNQGVVSLGGFVDSDAERNAAVAAAKATNAFEPVEYIGGVLRSGDQQDFNDVLTQRRREQEAWEARQAGEVIQ